MPPPTLAELFAKVEKLMFTVPPSTMRPPPVPPLAELPDSVLLMIVTVP